MISDKCDDQPIKLLCFSHAGSSATVFHQWDSIFYERGVEIVPVEMPGRGLRSDEPFCHDVNVIVRDIFRKYKRIVEHEKYALFGHSMGSLIVYEFCKYCKNQGANLPLHIFVSGRSAPHIPFSDRKTNKSDDAFLKDVYDLGGCEEDLIKDADLRYFFLPILRNDFALVEQYKAGSVERFECGITVLNGLQDKISHNDLEEWSRYTSDKFEIINFKGGHFYLFDYPQRIAQIVTERI